MQHCGMGEMTNTQTLLVFIVLIVDLWIPSDCYDPLDPDGNITVTFDIQQWTQDGYMARVTIQNYYQYRRITHPGWSLGWNWTMGEVIWSMTGAFAVHQGNCSEFKFRTPHSCEPDPIIADLTPQAPSENQTNDCCRGGVLSARAIDMPNSFSSFFVEVGNLGKAVSYLPINLRLDVPDGGYTCSPLADVPPTVVKVVNGQRDEQVFRTWKSACTYSTFVADHRPTCCVSLSTFYNPNVTPCRTCACSCSVQRKCISGQNTVPEALSTVLSGAFQCTAHMCPVRVHWHVMSNYVDHWRIKLTLSNYAYGNNYTDWNLVVQHPGFSQPAQIYSFNSTKLLTVGRMDDAAIFWGLQYLNDELLQASGNYPGSVTTEILLAKDRDLFTLRNGWPLPRRIYFNGESCDMPLPDSFPGLPSVASIPSDARYLLFFLLPFILYNLEL